MEERWTAHIKVVGRTLVRCGAMAEIAGLDSAGSAGSVGSASRAGRAGSVGSASRARRSSRSSSAGSASRTVSASDADETLKSELLTAIDLVIPKAVRASYKNGFERAWEDTRVIADNVIVNAIRAFIRNRDDPSKFVKTVRLLEDGLYMANFDINDGEDHAKIFEIYKDFPSPRLRRAILNILGVQYDKKEIIQLLDST